MSGIRGKLVSSIYSSPASGASPALSFVVPVGTIFKGVVQQFSEAGGANNIGCMRLINNTLGVYAAFLSYGGAATSGEKYGVSLYIELPPGTYSSDWIKAPAGSSNFVSLIGNCYLP